MDPDPKPNPALAMKSTLLLLLTALPAFATLPSVGPDYVRPSDPVPAVYRDAGGPGAWKAANPSEGIPRGEWWRLFGDPTLDRLEALAASQNQDLHAAAARVQQAAATVGVSRSAFFPQVGADPSATRSRMSTTTDNPFPVAVTSDFSIPILATWEIDLFGRVRRLTESARDDAEASMALFESVRLSLSASVASNYFSLRGLDRELAILRDTVALRRRELELISDQQRSGVATELDTSRAETELAVAETDSAAVAIRRESFQDALAVLAGESATSFSIPAAIEEINLPAVPAGLPSDLLERRPDVAAAERSLASANARIGVAKAAFFPAISLTGSAGYESGETERLFGADSRIWSIGPAVYLPIFQGGRNRANLERSRGAYEESVAAYRQQVLVAFREVQEALTTMRLLADQAAAQDRAITSAKRAASLAQTRYNAGYVSYLDVVDAERTELNNERAGAQLVALRLNADVSLIKGLGGSWSDAIAR
jgi:multidrug efflux system outer membrane protein